MATLANWQENMAILWKIVTQKVLALETCWLTEEGSRANLGGGWGRGGGNVDASKTGISFSNSQIYPSVHFQGRVWGVGWIAGQSWSVHCLALRLILFSLYFWLSPHATDYIEGNSMLLLFFAFKILCNDWIIYTELYFKNLLVVTARCGFFLYWYSSRLTRTQSRP